MSSIRILLLAAAALVACGGSSSQSGLVAPTGTLFGASFVAQDALLVHPQTWKSADPGSTALLLSDTSGLCAQITSGKTTAPGRLLIVLLEQTDGSGAVVPVTPGTFTMAASGTTNAKYATVYGSKVDAACTFSKAFAQTVTVVLTQAGSPLQGTLDAHLTNGDAQTGTFSVSSACDQAAVDKYLNANPVCG